MPVRRIARRGRAGPRREPPNSSAHGIEAQGRHRRCQRIRRSSVYRYPRCLVWRTEACPGWSLRRSGRQSGANRARSYRFATRDLAARNRYRADFPDSHSGGGPAWRKRLQRAAAGRVDAFLHWITGHTSRRRMAEAAHETAWQLFSRRPERAGSTTVYFPGIRYGGNFPSSRCFEQTEGVDSAVSEFPIQVEIILGPEY